MWTETCQIRGQAWAIVKPKPDNAKKVRGIYFIDQADRASLMDICHLEVGVGTRISEILTM